MDTLKLSSYCLWLWDNADLVGKSALPRRESQVDNSALSFKQGKCKGKSVHIIWSQRQKWSQSLLFSSTEISNKKILHESSDYFQSGTILTMWLIFGRSLKIRRPKDGRDVTPIELYRWYQVHEMKRETNSGNLGNVHRLVFKENGILCYWHHLSSAHLLQCSIGHVPQQTCSSIKFTNMLWHQQMDSDFQKLWFWSCTESQTVLQVLKHYIVNWLKQPCFKWCMPNHAYLTTLLFLLILPVLPLVVYPRSVKSFWFSHLETNAIAQSAWVARGACLQ